MTCLLQKSCCSTYCYKIDSNNSHSPYCCLEWHQSHVSLQIFPLHFHFQTTLLLPCLLFPSYGASSGGERERFYLLSFIAQIYFESLSSFCTQKRHTPNTQSKKGENRVCSFGAAWLGIILKILLLLDIPIIPFSLSHFLVFQYFFTLFVSLLFFFFIFFKKVVYQ